MSAVLAAYSQEAEEKKSVRENPPCTNARRLPTENAGSYKQWLRRDVAYIITAAEKKSFAALKCDEDREIFIDNFWQRRDPEPDTPENEFRDEYYARIKYANENFESGVQGWMTDRGLIYILFGKPDKIDQGRANFENFKNILFETWSYKVIDGFNSDIKFTFIDPTEAKEFRLPESKRAEILKFAEAGLSICFMYPKESFSKERINEKRRGNFRRIANNIY